MMELHVSKPGHPAYISFWQERTEITRAIITTIKWRRIPAHWSMKILAIEGYQVKASSL